MRMVMLAGLILLMGGRALGQLHVGDLALTVVNGKVVVNSSDGNGLVPQRVFADRFGKLGPSLPNRTPDPGFNTVAGAFPAGQVVGVMINKAARVWTAASGGDGEGEFCTIPEERIEIRKSGNVIVSPMTDPMLTETGPSIELGVTDGIDGQFHEHGVFWLTMPWDAGVYVVEVVVWVGTAPPGVGTVSPSDPVWVVLNQNRPSEETDDAVAWLEAHVANAPGAGGSLCPPMPPGCPCDWNGVGGLSVQDIFDYLVSYFAGAGDFNGVGGTTVQDIFDFLGCYFAAC